MKKITLPLIVLVLLLILDTVVILVLTSSAIKADVPTFFMVIGVGSTSVVLLTATVKIISSWCELIRAKEELDTWRKLNAIDKATVVPNGKRKVKPNKTKKP